MKHTLFRCRMNKRRKYSSAWHMLKFPLLVCVMASSSSGYQGTPALSEEMRRSPIHLGVQLMTGVRTDSIWRGREIAHQVLESQIASSFALNNDWALSGEFDYNHGFSSRETSHATLYSELQYYLGEEMTVGPLAAGQWFNNCVFRNGMDLGGVWRWNPTRDWETQVQCLYDTGQEGWYSQIAVTWQPLISESTAWQSTIALGGVKDYFGTSGANEVMLRTGFLIRMGAYFRLQPFIAYSWGVGNENTRRLYGGCWFIWQF